MKCCTKLTFSLLALSQVALANPTTPLYTLAGTDRSTKQECFLYVLSEDTTHPEGYRAQVTTSYTHDGDQAQPIEVRPVANRPGLLHGKGANGVDETSVFFSSAPGQWATATHFNFRWWHVNHPHNDQCRNLQLR